MDLAPTSRRARQPSRRSWMAAVYILIFAASVSPGQTPPTEAGAVTEPATATPQSGDAERGRTIFEGKGGCLNCHRVGGRGSRLGPDLTSMGRRRATAGELERSILDPGAEILPRNRFYRVVTAGGETITGRLLNHDAFTVQLIDPQERLLSLQKPDLREHGFVKNSPMPSYRGKLTAEELNDVVAYLIFLNGNTQ